MREFLLIILASICIFNGYSQNGQRLAAQDKSQKNQITGKIVNQNTGDVVPFCNISVASLSIGTSSNELGEFILEVSEFPVKIIFSHINYEQIVLETTKNSDILIQLVPLTNVLDEVTVMATKKKDYYAIELAKKAYIKSSEKSNQSSYGKAFYRQKSKNGEQYSEFSEIIYDTRYNSKGIVDWEIMEGRYALKENSTYNRNFTLLSRLLKPLQPNTDELIFPLHPELELYYDLSIIDLIKSGDERVAVIWFKPKKNSVPTFEGEVYINTQNFNILKVNGSLSNDNLKLVKLKDKDNGYWKNYKISYELAYKQDGITNSLVDYVKVDQSFDYYKDDALQYPVTSSSNLTFFEYYTPTSRKKLGGQFRKKKSDWQKLDEIGYNKKFWEDNPIVKRTPVEDEVIASFDKKGAFGSIFLNSRDQVTLNQSNLFSDPFIGELGSVVTLFNNYNPVEKVYLHTDKDILSKGESLWYSAYVVLGSYHQYSMASKVIHVDLINSMNEIVISQTHALVNGKSAGCMKIPKNIPSGGYQIRSYTDWMRNFDQEFFFGKAINVVNENEQSTMSKVVKEDIDLQFFPEGGHLVKDLNTQVAFKAIGEEGFGKDVSGNIFDSQGNSVAILKSLKQGMGFFFLKPEGGNQYKAILSNGSEYSLPKIMDKGYAMTINNFSAKSIKVKVQSSESLKDKSFYIVGHIQNKKYYQGKFSFDDYLVVDFEIPKSKLPSGAMTFTLFDEDKKPWCERLVFVNNQEELVITAKMDQKKFKKRDDVLLEVQVTDTDGRPVSTELSIGITDVGQVRKKTNAKNILTYLLMESDLKGHIEDPALLFKDQKRNTLNHLDLVMLTHGWRSFNWKEIWNNPNPANEFPFAKGFAISGVAKGSNNKPLLNTTLSIVAKSGKETEIFSAMTSDIGKFSLNNFNLKDSVSLMFRARDAKERVLKVKSIVWDENKTIEHSTKFKPLSVKNQEEEENYLMISATRKKMDSIYKSPNTTKLDEVTVTGKQWKKKSESRSAYGGITADATIYAKDKNYNNILQLIGSLPSVQVSGFGSDATASIRNGGNPLWILDGVPISESSAGSIKVGSSGNFSANGATQSDQPIPTALGVDPKVIPSSIVDINYFSVDRVEVLKGVTSGIYGTSGNNGVILVYTKTGEEVTQVVEGDFNPDFTILGYTTSKKFYSPKYDLVLNEHLKPDYRATLYWKPSIKTDKQGKASLVFYTSDNAKQVEVVIEGLSEYGIPGTYSKIFGERD